MQTQTVDAIRSYRLCFRDSNNVLARTFDVDMPSDDEVRDLAALMLEEQGAHACAEVWDRARLVCTVRREVQ